MSIAIILLNKLILILTFYANHYVLDNLSCVEKPNLINFLAIIFLPFIISVIISIIYSNMNHIKVTDMHIRNIGFLIVIGGLSNALLNLAHIMNITVELSCKEIDKLTLDLVSWILLGLGFVVTFGEILIATFFNKYVTDDSEIDEER